jgi:LmbE family N-acetylglucosaminyl deacetylase
VKEAPALGDSRILVIAAHPDDEILGCGGTVALHARAGDEVAVVIACEGESVRYGSQGADLHRSAREAAAILGTSKLHLLDLPDQRLDSMSLLEIIRPIEEIIAEFRPRIIYTQFGGDANRDHELLFKAVLIAARPIQEGLETLLAFETASSTEWSYPRTFAPDTWVDISSTLDLKLQAMARYGSEVREHPHPRSLEGLTHRAKAWGSQACLDSAEVFMTIRRICPHGKTPV